MKDIKSAFSLACVYSGIVIGAGFASGQEIWRFFGRFGYVGVWGIIIATFLLGFVGSGMLMRIYRLKIDSYEEYCKITFGNRISGFVAMIGACFMLTCFCVMLAGSGAIFEQELGLDSAYGVVFLALVCFMTFLYDIKGVTVLNAILAPLMLVGMLILGGHALLFGDKGVISSFAELLALNDNWLVSAFVYVSYNLLTVPAVLCTMRDKISSKRVALIGGGAASFVLCIGGLGILFSCISGKYVSAPLPALAAAGIVGEHFRFYYCLVIFMAMLTAATGCGIGFIKYVGGNGKIGVQSALLCFLGSCLAMVGFTKLVEHLYTLFGYLGLFIALILVKDSIIEFKLNFFKKQRN